MSDEIEERAEFYVRRACVLTCTPGNLDRADGEPATIITLGGIYDGTINPLILDMRDSRLLAVKVLIALASNHDEFAAKVLDEQFPADMEGCFYWPRDSVL